MQTTQKGPADKEFQTSKFLFNCSCYYVKQLVGNGQTTKKKTIQFDFSQENSPETHRNHI